MAVRTLIRSGAKRLIKARRQNEEIGAAESELRLIFLNTKNGVLRPWDPRLLAFRRKHPYSDEGYEELAYRTVQNLDNDVRRGDPRGRVTAGSFYDESGAGFRINFDPV